MKKFVYIIFIVLIFVLFGIFEITVKSKIPVLRIVNASTVVADINKNGKEDIGETICVPDVKTFTADLLTNQKYLEDKLKISKEDGIKLGYLSDLFAENMLSDKLVKLKKYGKYNDCLSADLLINNESYREKLILSGYGIEENSDNKKVLNKLKSARNLDLVILNHKSNKYHKLNCEYGLVAHDAVIVPKKSLTEASPCKFCFVNKKHSSKLNGIISNYPLVISNGDIKLYLTDSTLKLKPDKSCTSTVCQMLLKQISESKESIDIAMYGWNSVPPIYNELQKAKQRGVKIRLVYDISKINYYPNTSEIVALANESSHDRLKTLMHNKFMIFDNSTVITGSMNFSQTGLSGFNSNTVLLIKSNEIANIYKNKFNEMLFGKFSNDKKQTSVKTIILNKTKLTPLFSPEDKIITKHIIPLINSANTYVYVPAFTITHRGFAEALINAQKRGVEVKIIIDATKPNAKNSYVKELRKHQIPVKVENYAGKLHSKSIIIDDKYIIAGSMNFTNSGENYNDENTLIIEDDRFAKYYKNFFNYYWNKIPDKYLKYNPSAEGKSSIGSCSDGIDNNYNGKIDSEDSACN